MKRILLRMIKSFSYSLAIALIVLALIEIISTALGYSVSPMTPEFISYFPTTTIAFAVDLLLYGVFGLVFSGMSFIYEIDRLGFVVQNILYCLGTAVVWIPIITFLWQLWKYPQALLCTIGGFIVTYVIMTITAYNRTRMEVSEINMLLGEKG